MQGVPTPVAIGFLLAAPTINPIVIWATWTAFREQPEIVVLRVLLSLLIATIVGYIFSFQQDLTPILQPAIARYLKFNPPPQPKTNRQISRDQQSPSTPPLMREANSHSLLQPGTYLIGSKLGRPTKLDPNLRQPNNPNFPPRKSLHEKLSLVLDNIVQELRELGGVMVLGSAIAATIQVLSPRELILSLGSGPISSIVAMMLLASAVSICSTVDSFFALSFASTFTSGSLLAFLVFGPMIDIKGVGLMLSIFRPRALFYLFGLAGMMTLLSTLFLNLQIM
jgi:uncharacterized membrane protein YraQ (UPF0718 family)